MSRHPLDEVTWSSLSGRHAAFAVIRGAARRYDARVGVFAAIHEQTSDALLDLGALVGELGDVALLQADPPAEVPGAAIASQDAGVQMTARSLRPGAGPPGDIVALSDADAPEMLALATLTEPGPFFKQTNRLGDFVGVRAEGQLVAMAGERMKPAGHTEVSGVCTHPDHRGRGLAAHLMRHVSQRILDRGETPFLHAYASNGGAIALYQRLGFTLRREILMTRLTPQTRPTRACIGKSAEGSPLTGRG